MANWCLLCGAKKCENVHHDCFKYRKYKEMLAKPKLPRLCKVCGQTFGVKAGRRQATCGGPCAQKYVKMTRDIDNLRRFKRKRKIVTPVSIRENKVYDNDDDSGSGGD